MILIKNARKRKKIFCQNRVLIDNIFVYETQKENFPWAKTVKKRKPICEDIEAFDIVTTEAPIGHVFNFTSQTII